MAEGQLQIFAPEANEASIRACALKALELGGGTVMLPPGTIQLSQPLPVGSGLKYVGAVVTGWVEMTDSLGKGTILLGDGVIGASVGTFNCFEWNPDDGASITYASTTALHADSPQGFAVEEVILRGFKYGMKLGALYKAGVIGLRLDHVLAEHCDVGFWLENCQQPDIGYVRFAGCRTGGFAYGTSMGALWHYGNGNIEHVIGQNSGHLSSAATWGIDIFARGSNSELNNVVAHNLQANGYNEAVYTQTAGNVVVSGSPDILITSNIDKFRVGSWVNFGTAGGNISTDSIYAIVAKTDNGNGTGSIRVAFSRSRSAITPSANINTTITLRHPLVMIGGHFGNALTNCSFPVIDAEAASGIGLLLQCMNGTYVETSIISGATGFVSLLYTDSSYDNTILMNKGLINVWINVTGAFVNGQMPASYFGSTAMTRRMQGLFADANVKRLIVGNRRTTENMTAEDGDIFGADPSGFSSIGLGKAVRKFHGRLGSGSTVTQYSGGLITYTGTGGGNLTLPAITSGMVGLELEVMNPSSGNLTLNSSSSQTFNGGAGTSFTVAANTLAYLRACTADGSTFFWAAR